MTYLNFVLVYLALPVLILWLTQPRPVAAVEGPRASRALLATCLLTFLYGSAVGTYLVFVGAKGYEADSVTTSIGYVPVEEYVFFLAVPLFVGLVLLQTLGRMEPWTQASPAATSSSARIVGSSCFGLLAVTGGALLLAGGDETLYMGITLVTAGPILLALWLYGGHYIWNALRRPFLITVGLCTGYLWIAVWAAAWQYIWLLSPRYSLLTLPGRFPIEELVFHMLYVVMITTTLLTVLAHDRISMLTHNDAQNAR